MTFHLQIWILPSRLHTEVFCAVFTLFLITKLGKLGPWSLIWWFILGKYLFYFSAYIKYWYCVLFLCEVKLKDFPLAKEILGVSTQQL